MHFIIQNIIRYASHESFILSFGNLSLAACLLLCSVSQSRCIVPRARFSNTYESVLLLNDNDLRCIYICAHVLVMHGDTFIYIYTGSEHSSLGLYAPDRVMRACSFRQSDGPLFVLPFPLFVAPFDDSISFVEGLRATMQRRPCRDACRCFSLLLLLFVFFFFFLQRSSSPLSPPSLPLASFD